VPYRQPQTNLLKNTTKYTGRILIDKNYTGWPIRDFI
jgi:hypothetical protein